MNNSAERVLGATTTAILIASLLAPWTGGLINYVSAGAIGKWVMFPDGYEDTLLTAFTGGLIRFYGWLEKRKIVKEQLERNPENG